jgi:hypothetical protein
MTAEVAILNTQGVAIAADSAVTISIGSGESKENKIFYTAEKIFNISEKLPIGIMIYNSANFMGINWKLIINEYSNRITDKDRFKKLEDCFNNFIKFLSDFEYIEHEHKEKIEEAYLINICKSFIKKILEYNFNLYKQSDIKDEYSGFGQEFVKKNLTSTLKKQIDNFKKIKMEKMPFPDFSGKYIISHKEILKVIFERELEFSPSPKQLEDMINLLIFQVKTFGLLNFSGIVFVGYGEEEIFPSVCSAKILGKLDNDLLYIVDGTDHIDIRNSAMINPYAQVDVINTFICGIDPKIQDDILKQLEDLLKKTGLCNEEEKIKAFVHCFSDILQKQLIDEGYKYPILEIVASLPTINLAEMAEALINITSLRRHHSTDQDTVGGPTDVAIISKVDGFVWIKRKNNLTYLKIKNGI